MEGRRISLKAATATTLALTGGYLLMEGDFKPNQKGRRINDYLIRRPFPFTRVTRSALQSEGYGHPGGHLSRRARPVLRRHSINSLSGNPGTIQLLEKARAFGGSLSAFSSSSVASRVMDILYGEPHCRSTDRRSFALSTGN